MVRKFEGRTKMKPKQDQIKISKEKEEQEPVPVEVKKLQEELRKAKLHNELLNTMIDIAEDKLKIDIRKKSGTKAICLRLPLPVSILPVIVVKPIW